MALICDFCGVKTDTLHGTNHGDMVCDLCICDLKTAKKIQLARLGNGHGKANEEKIKEIREVIAMGQKISKKISDEFVLSLVKKSKNTHAKVFNEIKKIHKIRCATLQREGWQILRKLVGEGRLERKKEGRTFIYSVSGNGDKKKGAKKKNGKVKKDKNKKK